MQSNTHTYEGKVNTTRLLIFPLKGSFYIQFWEHWGGEDLQTLKLVLIIAVGKILQLIRQNNKKKVRKNSLSLISFSVEEGK